MTVGTCASAGQAARGSHLHRQGRAALSRSRRRQEHRCASGIEGGGPVGSSGRGSPCTCPMVSCSWRRWEAGCGVLVLFRDTSFALLSAHLRNCPSPVPNERIPPKSRIRAFTGRRLGLELVPCYANGSSSAETGARQTLSIRFGMSRYR